MGGGSTSESASNIRPEDGQEDQSEDLSVAQDDYVIHESLFGIMGEYGNNLMIYTTDSIILKH